MAFNNGQAVRFAGASAVVTGAGSGIGLAIAQRIVAEGGRVVLADVNEPEVIAAASRIGAGALPLVVDVTDEDAVAQMVVTAVAEHGPLTCAFNVAGAGAGGSIVDMPVADWRRTIDVFLTGVFLCLKYEARSMIAQGDGGAIVNMASINGFRPGEGAAAYSTAKAGVVMLTNAGALELGEHGIRVSAIAPGLVETPMSAPLFNSPAVYSAFIEGTPLGRHGTVDDVAGAALFLAGPEASWVSGTTLVVDGGGLVTGYPRLTKLFGDTALLPAR